MGSQCGLEGTRICPPRGKFARVLSCALLSLRSRNRARSASGRPSSPTPLALSNPNETEAGGAEEDGLSGRRSERGAEPFQSPALIEKGVLLAPCYEKANGVKNLAPTPGLCLWFPGGQKRRRRKRGKIRP